jgi:hypothetical protein
MYAQKSKLPGGGYDWLFCGRSSVYGRLVGGTSSKACLVMSSNADNPDWLSSDERGDGIGDLLGGSLTAGLLHVTQNNTLLINSAV